MIHPGKDLLQEIKGRNWTQKYFSLLLGKKVSEVNELIKGKRNITIQRDLLLSNVLGSEERYRLGKQIDYDYAIAKKEFKFDTIKVSKTPKISEKKLKLDSLSKGKKIKKDKELNKDKKIETNIQNKKEDKAQEKLIGNGDITKTEIKDDTKNSAHIFRDF